ncbi:MAG TPA: FAD-dependent oxidoreductase, partial [Candidatus Aquilonibacter sp.]
WDADADVVVIGGGGSGLRAALAAASGGARTLLCEKTSNPGGKTAMSIGIMTASESFLQREAGIEDSHDRHLDDIRAIVHAAGKDLDEDTVRFILASSTVEVARLATLGVRFSGPHPEGAHTTPRMHVVQPDCRELVRILVDACSAAAVEIRTSSPGRDLLLDRDGAIAGVAIDTPAGERRIRARAVVLAAGDYSGDVDFIRAVAPQARIAQTFRTFASGDGHRMGMRAGADTQNMAAVNVPHMRFRKWPFVEPSPKLFDVGAVLLSTGGRVTPTTETESAGILDYDGTSDLYVVIDGPTSERVAQPGDDSGIGRNGWRTTDKPFIGTAPGVGFAYLADCPKWEWYRRYENLADMACDTGIALERLSTVLRPENAPFHVLGPAGEYLMNSGGGLRVDRTMNVLDNSGEPIPGLFSGGTNARIIPYIGHGYALAWAMASGHIAGTSAAAFAR